MMAEISSINMGSASQTKTSRPLKKFDEQNSIDKSIFNIKESSLSSDAKALLDAYIEDLDGDGLVSEGDFSSEQLKMTNGSKTFKDYLFGVFGKSWDIGKNIIQNIKAMFVQSMPETELNTDFDANATEIKNIVKDKNLKPGETFEYNGVTYNVGLDGIIIAQAGGETVEETYEDGKKSYSTKDEDMLNTEVYDQNGNLFIRRTDYDNGSSRFTQYNSNGTLDITLRAPSSHDDIPKVVIRENND